MTAQHPTQLEIDRNELEIIETALREQTQQLSRKMLDQQLSAEQGQTENKHQLSSQMKAIQSLLGNLHNQKIWYRPQDAVPLG